MDFHRQDIEDAHKFCHANREQLKTDGVCGCFHCCRIFSPAKIRLWAEDRDGDTAVCPYCGTDSVIGESSGYPITEEFLQAMKQCWFDQFVPI